MKSAAFVLALELIFKLEGGARVTDDPHDPGGVTKFGISARSFPELGEEGIKRLTKEHASNIYKTYYWDKVKGDSLPIDIAICVFDCAVNQGPGVAARLLQTALDVKVDGDIGVLTIGAANAAHSDWLLREFLSLRQLRYVETTNYLRYGKGWSNRLFHVCQGATLAKEFVERL